MDRVPRTNATAAESLRRLGGNVAQPASVQTPSFQDHDVEETRERQKLRQSYRQLEQISAAAGLFSLEFDRKRLFALIAAQASDLLRADQVVVYSNYDNRLTAESWWPDTSSQTDSPGEHVRWCVKYLKPKIEHHPTAPTIRNSLCVPLLATQNRVLAVIEARNKRTGGSFTELDLRIGNCFANVASTAVDRANLFYRIEDWKQSMETLLSFNATINQQLEPREMICELVRNVTGFLEADGGAAGIVVQADKVRCVVSETFYYSNQTHRYRRSWEEGNGIPGTVLQTEFPLLVNDYQTNPLVDRKLAQRFDIGSCICVPIKNANEEMLGFFKLHRRVGEPEFTWQDAAFLESLGNSAAVAIENARLVHSLELKNEKIKSLSQHHVRSLEQERKRIARELHDQSGQLLVGLKLRLKVLSGFLADDQSDARKELAFLQDQLNSAASSIKDLSKRLRPPTLDELGFESSIRQLLSEFRNQTELETHVKFEACPGLTSDAETSLFRIAQECLTNIIKHACARSVKVEYDGSGSFQVFRIKDDGKGFRTDEANDGLGLIGIRERVKMLGGNVVVESSPGRGTSITVVLGKEMKDECH